MKLYKTNSGIIAESAQERRKINGYTWTELVNRVNLRAFLQRTWNDWPAVNDVKENSIEAPIQDQEIWAAGVTYLRSKQARMEESQNAGGADFYDRVYDASRPELFFKSQAWRAKGHHEKVHIRKDSTWDVPEPELTLFISSEQTIEGFTIGNDMSSRSIEGENPLYLPQAKTYQGSASIGPCLLLGSSLPEDTQIEMKILRNDTTMYHDSIGISQMKRTFKELVEYLYREMEFPQGCYLMTGTCLIPDPPFTLQSQDEIRICIEPIGELINFVA